MIAQLAILTGMVLVAWAAGLGLLRFGGSDFTNWLGDVLVIAAPAAVAMFALVEWDLGATVDQWVLIVGWVTTAALGFTSSLWGREFRDDR